MAHQILQEFYLNGAVVYIDDTVIFGSKNGTIRCFAKTQDIFRVASVEILGQIFDE